MRKFMVTVMMALVLVLAIASSAFAAKYALIIDATQLQTPDMAKLYGVNGSVSRLQKLLEANQFSIQTVNGAAITKVQVLEALDRFSSQLSNPDDFGLLLFLNHGGTLWQNNFDFDAFPHDERDGADEKFLLSDYLNDPLTDDDLRARLNNMNTGTVVTIINTTRNLVDNNGVDPIALGPQNLFFDNYNDSNETSDLFYNNNRLLIEHRSARVFTWAGNWMEPYLEGIVQYSSQYKNLNLYGVHLLASSHAYTNYMLNGGGYFPMSVPKLHNTKLANSINFLGDQVKGEPTAAEVRNYNYNEKLYEFARDINTTKVFWNSKRNLTPYMLNDLKSNFPFDIADGSQITLPVRSIRDGYLYIYRIEPGHNARLVGDSIPLKANETTTLTEEGGFTFSVDKNNYEYAHLISTLSQAEIVRNNKIPTRVLVYKSCSGKRVLCGKIMDTENWIVRYPNYGLDRVSFGNMLFIVLPYRVTDMPDEFKSGTADELEASLEELSGTIDRGVNYDGNGGMKNPSTRTWEVEGMAPTVMFVNYRVQYMHTPYEEIRYTRYPDYPRAK